MHFTKEHREGWWHYLLYGGYLEHYLAKAIVEETFVKKKIIDR